MKNRWFAPLLGFGLCASVMAPVQAAPMSGADYSAAAQPAQRVVLLLHGMNSGPEVWNDWVAQYFNNFCPVIFDGTFLDNYDGAFAGTRCYRVQFGKYDAVGETGLEDAKAYADQANIPTSGDFSTFEQLGWEVESALLAIQAQQPQAQAVLVGHSRGGLAARAFLQGSASVAAKAGVAGLITTGTPHTGSELGRVYSYIENQLLRQTSAGTVRVKPKGRDWNTVDWLNGSAYPSPAFGFSQLCGKQFSIDVRRPTIKYLTIGSEQITQLNAGMGKLPLSIQYGQIYYQGAPMGFLSHDPIDYAIFADIEGPVLACPTISAKAEKSILHGKPPAYYDGDGIVTAGSQTGLQLAGASITLWTQYYDIPVLHIDEPEQTADIMHMFCALGFDWLGACGSSALPAQTAARPVPADAAGSERLQAVARNQAAYDALAQASALELWQRWGDLHAAADDAARRLTAAALAVRLQRGAGDTVYALAGRQLAERRLPLAQRGRLAGLLGDIATAPALEILLAALEEGEAVLQPAVLSAVRRLGGARLGQHPELSPPLERAWRAGEGDAERQRALALALAKVGAPQGIALLLDTLAQGGYPAADDPLWRAAAPGPGDARRLAAYEAMHYVRNPGALAVLRQAFTQHAWNDGVFRAAGDGLAALGRADATEILLQWARQAPDEARDGVRRWLGSTRDAGSQNLLRRRLAENRKFRSRSIGRLMDEVADNLNK